MNKKAVNWNDLDNDLYKVFWDQNVRQFWVDEEIPVSDDKQDWYTDTLTADEKDIYEKVLAALTLLDTEQGGVGMPSIILNIDNLHAKAIFSFMGMMEQMHAKSYSTIFSTLSSSERIDELFEWAETNELLQKKVKIIENYYNDIQDGASLYRALTASVMLETYLFYSGFYYPLWWAGHGKLIKSGEIISLIVRDESVHGVFTGLMAQEELKKLPEDLQVELKKDVYKLLLELHSIEKLYTKELYGKIKLEDEVMTYVEYNADKALMNLGLDPYFNIVEENVNSIVINGINTETKNHDFFSTKGNGYIKTMHNDEITDDIFDI
jgi:ribonucleoside-diphosphate reductase beta chain